MKAKYSNVYKRVLKASGFENMTSFETIVEEIDDEDETGKTVANISIAESRSDCGENDCTRKMAARRPVSPKRMRQLKTKPLAKSSPQEIRLPNKTLKKQCEIRHANQTLNRTLNDLLQRTSSLTEQLHRGLEAMEQSLDHTSSGNGRGDVQTVNVSRHKTVSNNNNSVSKVMVATATRNVLSKRDRQTRPVISQKGVAVRNEQQKSRDSQELKSAMKNTWPSAAKTVAEAKLQTQSPRLNRVNFVVQDPTASSITTTKSVSQSDKGKHEKVELSTARSLPNLKALDMIERPRSRSMDDASSNKTQTVGRRSLSLHYGTAVGVASNRNAPLISLRPPTKPEPQRSPVLRRQIGGKDDSDSLSTTTNTKSSTSSSSSWSSGLSKRNDSMTTSKKMVRRQCYKTTSGDMVKMEKLFYMLSGGESESEKMESKRNAEDLAWTQVRHCRYLRSRIESPTFCTCNQCESCRKNN
eukprot:gene7831-8681_t